MLPFKTLEQLAFSVGIDAVGVSRARPVEGVEPRYREWLERGYQGEMGYLERNLEMRLDPTRLVPGARSIVSVLLSYNHREKEVCLRAPRVSRYALTRDYHSILKERLYRLFELLRGECGEVEGRVFVDSAPFLDRYWAQRAGLGWIGKNALLIHPQLGSFTFIGSLVLDLEIEPREREVQNRCGRCTRCLEACPTGALLAPGLLDARRCISYLTIEKKSPLTEAEEASTAPWAFGCDACQEGCPWNRKAKWASLDDEIIIDRELLEAFARGERNVPKSSPMRRANRERLRHLLLRHRGEEGE